VLVQWLNKKILLAVLVLTITSIAVYLWFYSWVAQVWLIVGLFTVGILVVPVVVALLIAEYAEKRKYKKR
jgi:hypothetical protein